MDEHVRRISEAMKSDPRSKWGLRITDKPLIKGEKAAPSRVWNNGRPTNKTLPGTSVIGLKSHAPGHIASAFRSAGIGTPGSDYYPGQHVSLIRGDYHSAGEDPGESVLKNAMVHDTFQKENDTTGKLVAPPTGFARGGFASGGTKKPVPTHGEPSLPLVPIAPIGGPSYGIVAPPTGNFPTPTPIAPVPFNPQYPTYPVGPRNVFGQSSSAAPVIASVPEGGAGNTGTTGAPASTRPSGTDTTQGTGVNDAPSLGGGMDASPQSQVVNNQDNSFVPDGGTSLSSGSSGLGTSSAGISSAGLPSSGTPVDLNPAVQFDSSVIPDSSFVPDTAAIDTAANVAPQQAYSGIGSDYSHNYLEGGYNIAADPASFANINAALTDYIGGTGPYGGMVNPTTPDIVGQPFGVSPNPAFGAMDPAFSGVGAPTNAANNYAGPAGIGSDFIANQDSIMGRESYDYNQYGGFASPDVIAPVAPVGPSAPADVVAPPGPTPAASPVAPNAVQVEQTAPVPVDVSGYAASAAAPAPAQQAISSALATAANTTPTPAMTSATPMTAADLNAVALSGTQPLTMPMSGAVLNSAQQGIMDKMGALEQGAMTPSAAAQQQMMDSAMDDRASARGTNPVTEAERQDQTALTSALGKSESTRSDDQLAFAQQNLQDYAFNGVPIMDPNTGMPVNGWAATYGSGVDHPVDRDPAWSAAALGNYQDQQYMDAQEQPPDQSYSMPEGTAGGPSSLAQGVGSLQDINYSPDTSDAFGTDYTGQGDPVADAMNADIASSISGTDDYGDEGYSGESGSYGGPSSEGVTEAGSMDSSGSPEGTSSDSEAGPGPGPSGDTGDEGGDAVASNDNGGD